MKKILFVLLGFVLAILTIFLGIKYLPHYFPIQIKNKMANEQLSPSISLLSVDDSRSKEIEMENRIKKEIVALLQVTLSTTHDKISREIAEKIDSVEQLVYSLKKGKEEERKKESVTLRDERGHRGREYRGREFRQDDVDSLVRSEVQKQIRLMKRRRDPRVSRLKKVLAVEKMRRLVQGLVGVDEYEDELEF